MTKALLVLYITDCVVWFFFGIVVGLLIAQ